MTAEDTTTDEQVKQQLRSDLETLSSCCQAQDTLWPSSELLQSVEKSAKLLVAKERKKPPAPIWRGFQLLDKRTRLLRPANRVDILVKRALRRLQEGGESALDKLARQGDADRQKLVSDIESLKPT